MDLPDLEPQHLVALGLAFGLVIGGGVGAYASGAFDSNQSYSNYEVKQQIVENHNPGTCFGMPTVVSRETMEQYIETNPELAENIRSDYAINSKKELYDKMKQFEQVTILEQTGPEFRYSVKDGDCCTIMTHYSTYNAKTDGFSSVKTETKSTPC